MCYAGAVFKRFVIYNSHYFEYFQALLFDNLVESKFKLCNLIKIKLVFKINEYPLQQNSAETLSLHRVVECQSYF